MKSVLVHSGWWKHVSGVVKKEDAETDQARIKWEEDDEKALATIILCIKASQLNIIKNCQTSYEAWVRLEETYKPSGPLQKVSLYKRLINLTMSSGGNISQHINSFTELADKLSETGIVIQDELLVIMLLSSLPPEYEHFVVAIETRDSLPNLTTVKQKILEEGDRHKQKNEREEDTPKSQQAFALKVSQRENKFKKEIRNKNKTKGKCFNCGEFGHFARYCSKATRNNKQQQHLLHTLHAEAKNKANNKQWCIDSGATSHLCCERELFSNFVEHTEEISFEADKYIIAKGKGDVEISINGENIKLQNVLYSPELHMNFISVGRVVAKGAFQCNFSFGKKCSRQSNF